MWITFPYNTINVLCRTMETSLILNESALQQLPDDKKPLFIFEWLRFLDKVLVAAHKVFIIYMNTTKFN